jgi:hypothetical protein
MLNAITDYQLRIAQITFTVSTTTWHVLCSTPRSELAANVGGAFAVTIYRSRRQP